MKNIELNDLIEILKEYNPEEVRSGSCKKSL